MSLFSWMRVWPHSLSCLSYTRRCSASWAGSWISIWSYLQLPNTNALWKYACWSNCWFPILGLISALELSGKNHKFWPNYWIEQRGLYPCRLWCFRWLSFIRGGSGWLYDWVDMCQSHSSKWWFVWFLHFVCLLCNEASHWKIAHFIGFIC